MYGELATEYPRPRTIHSWDSDGRVLLCSSFTKSVAPGLRVGWVIPGRYHDKFLHMKYAVIGTNVPATQLAAAAFVREGHYHRHVRRMRQIYQRNMEIYTCWVREYFPAGSASPDRKAALCCGSSCRTRSIWSVSLSSSVASKSRLHRVRCSPHQESIATAYASTARCRQTRSIGK